ncbi:MAG: hypothetical protein M1812_003508 [Candelaria pacifica]|nr:MAG: hypothetical protein M1812_003508 [Candelaria pacifica]
MAANSINTFVLAVPDPLQEQASSSLEKVNGTLSYRLYQDSNIRTLSTNTANSDNDPAGLLYVPDLPPDDPCAKLTGTYIPQNATRHANLPDHYNSIALAPWISADCTLAYLASARADPLVKAFIFYLTDNSTAQPPAMSDPAWGLNDGGQWKTTNQYPVYAIPGQIGDTMMRQLSHYSGNVTNVTNGDQLSQMYDRGEYIRLYTEINTASQTSLPSLWVFLLIIAGVLLAVLATTSLVMHWIQRRHRRNLRHRVANGEVDLELLGIKRLKVPSTVLNKMPLFIYVAGDEAASHNPALPTQVAMEGVPRDQPKTVPEESEAATTSALPVRRNSDPIRSLAVTSVRPSPIQISPVTSKEYAPLSPPLPPSPDPIRNKNRSSNSAKSDLPHRVLPYSQSTCSICLDDFESHSTVVRELPCEHVFHPECVDTFLRTSSSLCPLCKKSVLPTGYCPDTLTNAMVRRERMARRSGHRTMATSEIDRDAMPAEQVGPEPEPSRTDIVQRQLGRVRRITSGGRRIFSAPTPSTVEMGNVRAVQAPSTPSLVAQRVPTQSRRAWARRRASTMLGHQPTVEEEEQARQATLPKWRKAIVRIFPGFS